MSDSTATFIGNLTRDPELRFAASGKAVLALSIAVNKRRQVDGVWEEEVSFFNTVAFDTLAENAAASLSKGTRIICTGTLVQREYENKEGEKKSTVELKLDSIGPDLRWATAEVTKTEKGSKSSSKGSKKADPVYDDSEPF